MTIANNTRAIAVAAVFLFGTAAQASPITLKYLNNLSGPSGSISGVSGNVYAGEFRFEITGGDTPYWDDELSAFCVDIDTTLKSSASYDVQEGLGGFTSAQQQNLDRLFTGYYETSKSSAVHSAAMQLAIWEIIEETSAPLQLYSSGDFSSSSFNGARGIADVWLADLGGLTGGGYEFFVLQSDRSQDLLSARRVDVPEPGTLLLSVAGLLGMGLTRRRSKRERSAG